MPKKIVFSNTNNPIIKTKVYRLASTIRVLLIFLIFPSSIYSFMSLFPISDGPYVGRQLEGVTFHWIFGTTLIFSVGLATLLNTLLIGKNNHKLAVLVSLLPLIHILFIAYAWSLMRV